MGGETQENNHHSSLVSPTEHCTIVQLYNSGAICTVHRYDTHVHTYMHTFKWNSPYCCVCKFLRAQLAKDACSIALTVGSH